MAPRAKPRSKRRVTPADEAATHAVQFIGNLTHTKGRQYAGQPFTLRPWQTSIVERLFGTLRPDGLRQYRTALLMLPRKNGKTELAAAIALYGLMGDNEPGAEVYSAAADRAQASLVFDVAAQMIRNDPELWAQCDIIDSQKRIVHRPSGSIYRALSAEAYSKHGFNCSLLVYDELHAAPNRELWDVLTTSQGARQQPLTLAISTAGYDRHSILWELYQYACKVRDGLVDDPTFFPVIYEAPVEADWQDEAVWAAANPALGDFRSLDEIRTLARRAAEVPGQLQSFRRLYLNQWTESSARHFDMAVWDRAKPRTDPEDLRGRVCYAGLDLASVGDVTALALLFPHEDGGYDVLMRYWVPQDGAKRRADKDRVPYVQWIEDGLMTATDGTRTDYDRIREDIRDLADTYALQSISYDRWNATQLIAQLQADGATCVPVGQGFATMTAPCKELTALTLSGDFRHGHDPILRWMAANACAEQDAAGNLKLSKAKSTEKIDGCVAAVMALSEAIRHEHDEDATSSVYDHAGVFMVQV